MAALYTYIVVCSPGLCPPSIDYTSMLFSVMFIFLIYIYLIYLKRQHFETNNFDDNKQIYEFMNLCEPISQNVGLPYIRTSWNYAFTNLRLREHRISKTDDFTNIELHKPMANIWLHGRRLSWSYAFTNGGLREHVISRT